MGLYGLEPRCSTEPAGKLRNDATTALAASLIAGLASHLLVAAITRRQLHAGFPVHTEPLGRAVEKSCQKVKTNIHNP